MMVIDYSLSLFSLYLLSSSFCSPLLVDCESISQLRSKDETETERRSQARTVRRSSRSVSPEGRDNR